MKSSSGSRGHRHPPGKLQLPETMQKGLKGAKGQIDDLVGDAEKMGQELLGKGKDILDQAEGALDNVRNLATDPGAAVAPMLCEGSGRPAHLPQPSIFADSSTSIGTLSKLLFSINTINAKLKVTFIRTKLIWLSIKPQLFIC